ncbi:hypothetical protein [Candidatus Symbiopectobacterium sp.]
MECSMILQRIKKIDRKVFFCPRS